MLIVNEDQIDYMVEGGGCKGVREVEVRYIVDGDMRMAALVCVILCYST